MGAAMGFRIFYSFYLFFFLFIFLFFFVRRYLERQNERPQPVVEVPSKPLSDPLPINLRTENELPPDQSPSKPNASSTPLNRSLASSSIANPSSSVANASSQLIEVESDKGRIPPPRTAVRQDLQITEALVAPEPMPMGNYSVISTNDKHLDDWEEPSDVSTTDTSDGDHYILYDKNDDVNVDDDEDDEDDEVDDENSVISSHS